MFCFVHFVFPEGFSKWGLPGSSFCKDLSCQREAAKASNVSVLDVVRPAALRVARCAAWWLRSRGGFRRFSAACGLGKRRRVETMGVQLDLAMVQNRFGTILGSVHNQLCSILVEIGMCTRGTGL